MRKGNPQKKVTFQDNFVKHWVTSSDNHPEGWNWWKWKTRKKFRRFSKKELEKEIQETQI